MSSTDCNLHVSLLKTWYYFLAIPMISRHYHQTNLSACERNSMVTSFFNTANPLLFEKNMFLGTYKAWCFLFNQITFSNLILGLLFCHIWSITYMFVSCPSIAVHNCKNISNHSIRCNSVSSSRSNVESVNPAYNVVSLSDSVINVSKSLKSTSTHSHSIDSSMSTFRVVFRRNIHRKRKLRKSVISSSFVNNASSYDIANKFVMGRCRINVLSKSENYSISSVFFLSALF